MNFQKLKKLQALLYKCELCDHVCLDFNDLDLHVMRNHLQLDSDGHRGKNGGQKSKLQAQSKQTSGCSSSALEKKSQIAGNAVHASRVKMNKMSEKVVGTVDEDQQLTTSLSGDSQLVQVDMSALVTRKSEQMKSSLKLTSKSCPRDLKSEFSRLYHEQSQCRIKSGSLNTENKPAGVNEFQITHVPDSVSVVESTDGSTKNVTLPLSQQEIQYQFESYPNITRIKVGRQKCSFLCNICKKTIVKSGTAKSHSLTHSVERPFQCNCCEKNYKTKGELKEHENNHTGHRPFKCKFCFQAFLNHQARYCHYKKCLAAHKSK